MCSLSRPVYTDYSLVLLSIPLFPASAYFTCVAVPCGGAGVIVGGLLIFFTKSSGRRAALQNWIVTLIGLGPVFVFLITCPTLKLVGVTEPYFNG